MSCGGCWGIPILKLSAERQAAVLEQYAGVGVVVRGRCGAAPAEAGA